MMKTMQGSGARYPVNLLALEPRFMFDGAGAVDAVEAVADDGADVAPEPAATDAGEGVSHVVFIDAAIADIQPFLEAVPAGAQIIMLDCESDGIAQIADILKNFDGLSSVHVFSHGDVGSVSLGNAVLDGNSLGRYADALADWGGALSDNGDILFYGCSVAADGNGADFIDRVAALTGADVAASDDLTGAAALGGDWVLEASAGRIETTEIGIDSYQGLLFDGTLVAGNALVTGLGGTDGYGETTLAKNAVATTALLAGTLDDGYWRVDVSSVFTSGFKMGATTYSGANEFYIDVNGYITLGHAASNVEGTLSTYNKGPIFAPFRTDMNQGNVSGDWADDVKAIYVDLDTTAKIVTVTYADVTPYDDAADREAREGNHFQVRFHDYGSANFGVEFRYADIQWSGSRATFAEAGWALGDAATFGTIAGSGTTAAKSFDTAAKTTTSGHVAVGVWAWNVSNGVVTGGVGIETTSSPITVASLSPTAPTVETAEPPPPRPPALPPAPMMTIVGGEDSGPPAGIVTAVRSVVTRESLAFAEASVAPAGEGFRVQAIASFGPGQGDALVAVRPVSVFESIGRQINFTLSADTFASTQADTQVALAATQIDGSALPAWLSFDSTTGKFTGQRPDGLTGEVVVQVIARDQNGNEAIATVRIDLGDGAAEGEGAPDQSGEASPDAGAPVIKLSEWGGKPAGKPTFAEELRMASRLSGARQAQMLAAAREIARNG